MLEESLACCKVRESKRYSTKKHVCSTKQKGIGKRRRKRLVYYFLLTKVRNNTRRTVRDAALPYTFSECQQLHCTCSRGFRIVHNPHISAGFLCTRGRMDDHQYDVIDDRQRGSYSRLAALGWRRLFLGNEECGAAKAAQHICVCASIEYQRDIPIMCPQQK